MKHRSRTLFHTSSMAGLKVVGRGWEDWNAASSRERMPDLTHLGVFRYECQRCAPLGRKPCCTRAADLPLPYVMK